MDNIHCQYGDPTICDSLPSYLGTAQQSQRDIAFNVSVAQNQYLGIDLTTTLFQTYGYTTQALLYVTDLLDLGYRALFCDVFWNEATLKWQLCPAVLPSSAQLGDIYTVEGINNQTVQCQPNVTLSSLYNSILSYIGSSDTDLAAQVLQVNLRLSVVAPSAITNSKMLQFGTTNLTGPPLVDFTSRIYTPANLAADGASGDVSGLGSVSRDENSAFPSAKNFLLSDKKRIVARAFYRDIDPAAISYNFSLEDSAYFFLAGSEPFSPFTTLTNNNLTHCSWNDVIQSNLQAWRMVSESNTNRFTNATMQAYANCGYGPVVNRSISSTSDLVPPLTNSFWSWAPGQPFMSNSSNTSDNSGPTAFRCALLYSDGWKVSNCYDSHAVLCRQNGSEFGWSIGSGSYTYFEAAKACPNGTYFAVPNTALENAVSKMVVQNNSVTEFPVWIDLNDISITGCWVTGGPYATCPYHTLEGNRNGVALISIAAAVATLLLGIMFLLTLDTIPLRQNQWKWRRLIAKYSEMQYEGVPS